MNSEEARAALDSVRETDRKMAEKMHWPFYRHALFGGAEGAIVAGLGMSQGAGTAVMGLGVVMLLALMLGDRKRDGMFVSGMKGKRTRPLMIFIMAVLLAALGVSLLVLREREGVDMLALALGGAVTVVLTLASMRWEKLYRAELREGTAL